MLSRLLPTNQAPWDRGVRVALGLGLLSLTVVGPETLWGLVGLVPLVTGLAGSCPAYSLCGVRTSSLDKAPTET